MPRVSVIIPCYNQGSYVDEAVESVLGQSYQDFEIVIVNDGSTDELINTKLLSYNKPKTRVIVTANQGLAEARNTGIRNSSGEFILPLDADDKIGPTYLEKAVKIFESDSSVGIVYCNASLFGEKVGKWDLPDFSVKEILLNNIIFCSGIYRRKDYNRTVGYRKEMKYGFEDWDYWLSLIELDLKVVQIPDRLFFYRIKKGSMIGTLSNDIGKLSYMHDILVEKHIKLYLRNGMNPIALARKNWNRKIRRIMRSNIRRIKTLLR